jgi:ABC-type molybdate transport system substrate-binding protein
VAIAKSLKIFSGGAMRPLIAGIVPRFERAHGVAVEIEFRLSAASKQAIEDGASFDIAILPRPELDDLAESGAIAPGSIADVARSTVGLAVRAGAAKPDIGSVAALRHTLVARRRCGGGLCLHARRRCETAYARQWLRSGLEPRNAGSPRQAGGEQNGKELPRLL